VCLLLQDLLQSCARGKEGGEKKESEEECESESNPKPRPQAKPSSVDVAERGVASIGVRSSGNLQGKEAALTHTNGHTGGYSTMTGLVAPSGGPV
jgi:hypothetical protein